MIKTAIGISQKWDPINCSIEAIEEVKSHNIGKPSFIFVFATIEYGQKNGFKKILSNIAASFLGVPIVGGTVGGFMSNKGVFSHGLAVISVSLSDAKIIPFYAENTKRNPKQAAQTIFEKIRNSDIDNYEKKIIINFLPGPTIPSLPIINTINFVSSDLAGTFLAKFGLTISSFLGYGIAKDDLLLQELRNLLPEYYLIGGATMDNGKLIQNYQFYGTTVSNKAIVGVCIATNELVEMGGVLEMEKTLIKFKVTKTSENGTVIDEIENRPAFDVLKEKLSLKDAVFKNRHLLYRTTLYYPISTSEDIESSTVIGAIYGKKLLIGHKLKDNNIELLSASGNRILETPEKLNTFFAKNNGFLFASACETGFEAIGSKIFRQKSKLDEIAQNKPYFIAYFSGEHYSKPNQRVNVRSHSFNILTMG